MLVYWMNDDSRKATVSCHSICGQVFVIVYICVLEKSQLNVWQKYNLPWRFQMHNGLDFVYSIDTAARPSFPVELSFISTQSNGIF